MRTVVLVLSASLMVLSYLTGCTRENTGLQIGGDGGGGSDLGLADGGAPCNTLPQTACALRPDCRVDTCPTCDGTTTFIDCAKKTDPAIGCGLDCPAPCSVTNDAAQCNSRPDCHAVFYDPGTCDCATPGCCMQFQQCADGPAQCTGNPACAIPSPICGPGYVTSYTTNCYEGCVLSSECK
jgi:hypothetical protein